MDIFDTLTMLGGLALFLFGMSLMGQALERRAGGKLRSLLDKMTGKPIAGFLTGLGVTAVIQKLFRHDRYGRRLCKLRTDDAAPVDQRHYGRKRRHDRNGVAFESRRH